VIPWQGNVALKPNRFTLDQERPDLKPETARLEKTAFERSSISDHTRTENQKRLVTLCSRHGVKWGALNPSIAP